MIFASIALWVGIKTMDKSVESNHNSYYKLGIGLILLGISILCIEMLASAITVFSVLGEIVSILFVIFSLIDCNVY